MCEEFKCVKDHFLCLHSGPMPCVWNVELAEVKGQCVNGSPPEVTAEQRARPLAELEW